MNTEINAVIRIAIVEDNPIICQTLAQIFATSPEFLCLGTYATGELLLKSLSRMTPDVILMDINLPGLNSIDCVGWLKVEYPSVPVIMLTVFEDSDRVFQALCAGANGYLLKDSSPEKFLQTVRFVYSGGAAVTGQVVHRIVEEFKQLSSGKTSREMEQLSHREKEVLEKLAQGCLVKEIAAQLGVGFGTVRTYVRRIYEKLHVRSRTQAAAHYYQWQGNRSLEARVLGAWK